MDIWSNWSLWETFTDLNFRIDMVSWVKWTVNIEFGVCTL